MTSSTVFVAQNNLEENVNEITDTCSVSNAGVDCGNSEDGRLKWHGFDWKSYIKKDLRPEHRYHEIV